MDSLAAKKIAAIVSSIAFFLLIVLLASLRLVKQIDFHADPFPQPNPKKVNISSVEAVEALPGYSGCSLIRGSIVSVILFFAESSGFLIVVVPCSSVPERYTAEGEARALYETLGIYDKPSGIDSAALVRNKVAVSCFRHVPSDAEVVLLHSFCPNLSQIQKVCVVSHAERVMLLMEMLSDSMYLSLGSISKVRCPPLSVVALTVPENRFGLSRVEFARVFSEAFRRAVAKLGCDSKDLASSLGVFEVRIYCNDAALYTAIRTEFTCGTEQRASAPCI